MKSSTRTALVTGGIQGLGAAAAKALADAEYTVAVAYLGGAEAAKDFTNETGIPAFEWEVSDYDARTDGVARVEAAIGPVDVLVNNAGVNCDVMRDRGFGRVINISSVNAARGQVGQTNYCAAKAGVEGFTSALARESASKRITVDAIAPVYADTAMVKAVPDEIMQQILNLVPISCLAEPDEIGRCVWFLASEEAAFITGATLAVNGGLRMG